MTENDRVNGGQPDPPPDPLVAYLDGELAPDEARELERRLAEDPELWRRQWQHQQAWELLDELPHTEVSDTFTQTTVEMVALSAADEVDQLAKTKRRQKIIWRLAAIASLFAVATVGYWMTDRALDAPTRQLAKDWPIIQNLDAYRYADNIEFLRLLEQENLFTDEVEDGL